MNSGAFVLNDNRMHLDSWLSQNSALQGLQISGSNLIWNHDNQTESVNVENFYFPTLLYNVNFQNDITNPERMNAEDLFRIIEVHVLAQDLQNNSGGISSNSVITEFQYLADNEGIPFITFKDNEGKQYRLKNDLKEAFQIYQNLKNQQGEVKLADFKKELEQINHDAK